MLSRPAMTPTVRTAMLLPVPLPVQCEVHYGEPLYFEGNGDETDEIIDGHVARVRRSIEDLIERGRASRAKHLVGGPE